MTNTRSNRVNPEPLAQIVGREIISFCWIANWHNIYLDLLEAILLPQKESLPEKEANKKESRARGGFLMTPRESLDQTYLKPELLGCLLDEQIIFLLLLFKWV